MPTGVVKKFFEDKGFGFITPDDGGDDVFVHRKCYGEGNDRSAYLEEGDKVTYETEWDDRKQKYSASSCSGWKTGGGGGGGYGGGSSYDMTDRVAGRGYAPY
mmetsp:Transcript_111455/g.347409  ORF Transcript_111455/g.347409 Transcript_111455/m.347409 type:complete len:102 (+) Transcript_111455:74-379(+)|eukprot:CAMPEP_0204574370 /NCGR_PEP_ID=MMETSP0661-20131031/40562_1 /ASSEMBLY_ACC=CAM_ASM_000606 /TAXON_ID=109239 /ORGANISM="Alexandrium margalefi, Strain AMGDE01CS-322" /LENGTH=101 /DNA_ID=CAMNT_0051582891 /DNA_START=73 /DNA_END=378 /DNA_ORIENTATION=+